MARNAALRQILAAASSLRLTVALLVMSMFLIFAATLDQVHIGVWGVQGKYFHSFFIWTRSPVGALNLPIFPGGYLLGGILVVNLVAAHFTRFRLSAAKAGIWIIHLGLIFLLVGEGISGLMQRDAQMRIDVGATARYAESTRHVELAVVDTTARDHDDVVSIPDTLLAARGTVQDPRLPFAIRIISYYANAALRMRGPAAMEGPNPATTGAGAGLAVTPQSPTAKDDEADAPAVYVELRGAEGSLGSWLVSTRLVEAQAFSYQGRRWQLSLRPARDYLPFAITLLKFTHDVYPGTQIPKNFMSRVRLRGGAGRDDREVRIFMNNPLRYGGRAFYQAGCENNDRTTILQVVSNPSWQLPYLCCAMIALGLAVQFGWQLFRFLRGPRANPGAPAP